VHDNLSLVSAVDDGEIRHARKLFQLELRPIRLSLANFHVIVKIIIQSFALK
jgi:hypothetical protein